jgi:hypothetical protein
MPSSERPNARGALAGRRGRDTRRARGAAAGALLCASAWSARASAQQAVQGFAVERMVRSAPGAGWFVMDALDVRGGLGGAAGLTLGYANGPMRVRTGDGAPNFAVVSDYALAGLGFAATYDRFRVHLDFDMPLWVAGTSGAADGYTFTAPAVGAGSHPDAIADPRAGLDARLVGDADGRFRLGAGVQLIAPSGNRADYDTDGTYRATGRVLVAGDVGRFAYAGHVGVHLRPLDDSPAPESPRGSELLFGAAGGVCVPVALGAPSARVVVGPELFGASALRSLFSTRATALEGLLSARVEGTGEGSSARVRAGVGIGLDRHLGAADWRVVFGVELFGRRAAAP